MFIFRQHSETVRRCEHTMKELEYYRGQHHAAMAQLESAAQESSSLRTKYGELVSDLRSSQQVSPQMFFGNKLPNLR